MTLPWKRMPIHFRTIQCCHWTNNCTEISGIQCTLCPRKQCYTPKGLQAFANLVLWFGYGISVTPKYSCVGSLFSNVAMIRGCDTFNTWGLEGAVLVYAYNPSCLEGRGRRCAIQVQLKTLSKNKLKWKRVEGMAQVVESLPSKHEDNFELSSNPNTKKKKKSHGRHALRRD
jgi:hypothetical protein